MRPHGGGEVSDAAMCERNPCPMHPERPEPPPRPSATIINWPYPSRIDLPPEKVLNAACDQEFEGVVVLGFLKDGSTYMASSYADGGTVSWLVDRVKHVMHAHVDAEESKP